MTTIASNAALAILSQPAPRLVAQTGADTARSATDTILAIVSAAAKGSAAKTTGAPAPATPATTEPSATPRAVGGSVSSEPSKAQLGAMAAAGAMTTTYDPVAAANGFLPIQASVENAEAFVRGLSTALDDYNKGFEPDIIPPTREQYNAEYKKWADDRIAKGDDPSIVERDVAHFTSDDFFDSLVDGIKAQNFFKNSSAFYAKSAKDTAQHLFSEVFNQSDLIAEDKDGRLSIRKMTITYQNGRTMLTYDRDHGLTTYNEDGSVRSTYRPGEVSTR